MKSLQGDNALLFKKVVNLQDELVQVYNKEAENENKKQCSWEWNWEKEEVKVADMKEPTMLDFVKENFEKVIQERKHESEVNFEFSYSIPSYPMHKKWLDNSEISALCYNHKGSSIATGSAHGTLKLWDPFHGGETKILKNFGNAIWALTFSTDNQNLIACYVDGTIRVWRSESMKLFHNFHGHSDLINCSSYSHSEEALITGSSDRKIKLWDITRGVWTKSFSGFSTWLSIDSLAYGSLMASGHQDGTVKFWTPNQKQYIEQIEVHDSPVTSVNFTQDGRYLLTTSLDHTIRLIDVKQFEEMSMFEHEKYLNGSKTSRSTISPCGDYATLGSKDGSVFILKLNMGELELEEIYDGEHGSWVSIWAWQPNGGSFTTADIKGNFIIWQ